MRERTITINGLSKTYSVTGWRIGYAIAPPALTAGIRKVHDFLTVGAAAPLQEAGITALSLPDAYYRGLAELYAPSATASCRCSRKPGSAASRRRGPIT